MSYFKEDNPISLTTKDEENKGVNPSKKASLNAKTAKIEAKSIPLSQNNFG